MSIQQMGCLTSEVSGGADEIGKLKKESGYSKMATIKARVMAVTWINLPAKAS